VGANQDEGCLYLNVRAPADAPSRPKSVMVWIHGGGFLKGGGRIGLQACRSVAIHWPDGRQLVPSGGDQVSQTRVLRSMEG
jgi:hypothetical protein